MSERNQNEHPVSKREKTRILLTKIMAWVLSILMAGSVMTLTLTMLLGK